MKKFKLFGKVTKDDRRSSIATIAELKPRQHPTPEIEKEKSNAKTASPVKMPPPVAPSQETIEEKKARFKAESERTRKLLESGLGEKVEKILQEKQREDDNKENEQNQTLSQTTATSATTTIPTVSTTQRTPATTVNEESGKDVLLSDTKKRLVKEEKRIQAMVNEEHENILAEKRHTIQTLEQALTEENQTIEHLRQQLHQEQENSTQLQKELKEEKSMTESLQEQLKEEKSTIEQLRISLKEAIEEAAAAKQEAKQAIEKRDHAIEDRRLALQEVEDLKMEISLQKKIVKKEITRRGSVFESQVNFQLEEERRAKEKKLWQDEKDHLLGEIHRIKDRYAQARLKGIWVSDLDMSMDASVNRSLVNPTKLFEEANEAVGNRENLLSDLGDEDQSTSDLQSEIATALTTTLQHRADVIKEQKYHHTTPASLSHRKLEVVEEGDHVLRDSTETNDKQNQPTNDKLNQSSDLEAQEALLRERERQLQEEEERIERELQKFN